MAIHHATIKSAKKHGVDLITDEDGNAVAKATTGQIFRGEEIHAKSLVLLARIANSLAAEYKMLKIEANGVVSTADGEKANVHLVDPTSTSYDDALADILEAADAAGVDLDAEEEEEAERSIVVPSKYKEAYALRGNRNHCGDWIAATLHGKFDKVVDGALAFDTDAFTVFLLANGVEMTGKWAGLPTSGQKGWVGRFRMNGRQKLEQVVAKRGTLILGAEEIEVPAEDLAILRNKHPKWAPAEEAKETA